MSGLRPITEWLNELPDGYRALAIAQHDNDILECFKENAIWAFAEWDKTTEGWHFWHHVALAFIDRCEYPPLPKDAAPQGGLSLDELETRIRQWGVDRKILGPEGQGTVAGQMAKLEEEFLELDFGVKTGDVYECKDAIGDMTVVLVMLADLLGLSFRDCVVAAWDEIKDRKGEMRDGVFVKEVE